jgi:hypothetical protein
MEGKVAVFTVVSASFPLTRIVLPMVFRKPVGKFTDPTIAICPAVNAPYAGNGP